MGESITPHIIMALNPTNPWVPQKISPKSAIYVIPQDGTFFPENTDAGADLTKVEASKWKNIAAIKTMTYNQETEDDESQFFDAMTHLWVKEKNTQISGRTWEVEVERYTLFYEALLHGVADPLSDETIAKMSAGEGDGVGRCDVRRDGAVFVPTGEYTGDGRGV